MEPMTSPYEIPIANIPTWMAAMEGRQRASLVITLTALQGHGSQMRWLRLRPSRMAKEAHLHRTTFSRAVERLEREGVLLSRLMNGHVEVKTILSNGRT